MRLNEGVVPHKSALKDQLFGGDGPAGGGGGGLQGGDSYNQPNPCCSVVAMSDVRVV